MSDMTYKKHLKKQHLEGMNVNEREGKRQKGVMKKKGEIKYLKRKDKIKDTTLKANL